MNEFEDIIHILDELPKDNMIEEKLDIIIDLLEELIANNQENNEIETSSYFAIDINGINPWELGSCALLGFDTNEIRNCFTKNQIYSTNVIRSMSDLISIVSNIDDGDVFVLEFYKGYKRKLVQELIEIVRNRSAELVIGKGASAQAIVLELPDIHYVFLANSWSDIPNELLAVVDKVYVKMLP